MVFNKIKEIAKKKGIPIYKLEEKAGLSNGTISKWETVSPTLKSLEAVAHALGVDVSKLLK